MRNIYDLLRSTRAAQSKKNNAARALNRRNRTKRLIHEQLEPRMVMDAQLFGSGINLLAKGDDATWQTNSAGKNVTSSPVDIRFNSTQLLTAPDGGTQGAQTCNDWRFTCPPVFVPSNGLLTLATGQKLGDTSFAAQQKVEIRPNFFGFDVIPDGIDRAVTLTTDFKVPTTGTYRFYLTTDKSDAKLSRINVGGKEVTPNASGNATLTVDLIAGVSNSFRVYYPDTFGGIRGIHKVEWDGPGFVRKSFDPGNDIHWSTYDRDGFGTRREGYIAPGAYLTNYKYTNSGYYANRYTTSFTVPTTGEYNFFLTTDSVAQLKFGSDAVISNNGGTTGTGKRTLTAGTMVNLQLDYAADIAPKLQLEWSGPNLSRQDFLPSNPLTVQTLKDNRVVTLQELTSLTPSNPRTFSPRQNTFTLSWNGQTTSPISYDATAIDVQNAINNLSSLKSVGGSVSVSRSNDGSLFNITFGGTTWFHPALLTPGNDRVRVTSITSVPLTSRNAQSTLALPISDGFQTVITNGNTFPIENAPRFTPTQFASKSAINNFGSIVSLPSRLQGYLELQSIGGRFSPTSATNVTQSPTGLRVDDIGSDYQLTPTVDSTGQGRPITLFQRGGLSFEVPSGTRTTLTSRDSSNNDLEFVSKDTVLLVNAPYEGGKLTLRLTGDATNPVFKANLRSGIVSVTSRMELVSFEVGGFVIPASSAVTMAYDASNDKFNFSATNLSVESPRPEGNAIANAPNSNGQPLEQVLESYGFTFSGVNYETAVAASRAVVFNSITDFDNAPFKVTGNIDPSGPGGYLNGTAAIPSDKINGLSYGTRFTASIRVPATGEYTFTPQTRVGSGDLFSFGSRVQRLTINGTTLFSATKSDATPSGKIVLIGGVEYSFEYTYLEKDYFYAWPVQIQMASSNYIEMLGGAERTFAIGAFKPSLNGTSYADFGSARSGAYNTEYAKSDIDRIIDTTPGISDAQRIQIKRTYQVDVTRSRLTVSGLPFALVGQSFVSGRNPFTGKNGRYNPLFASYEGVVSNPVKLTIPSASFSITKGVLSNIEDVVVDSFAIGQTTINGKGEFVTSYEPVQPSSAGGFKLKYFTRNTYDAGGAVQVPGNSFGIYGNKTQLPLTVPNVTLNGLADLGNSTSPALVITNSQFSRLSYGIPNVKVGNLTFTAATVGSAKPLTVNYLPPIGTNRKSYVVLGGATMKQDATVVKSDLKTVFGANGSDGLRIFPAMDSTPSSFTFGFGVADSFLAGTQAIKPAPGPNGMKLVYDSNSQTYNFLGNGFIDFNPTSLHTANSLEFTGTPLAVTATAPQGITNFPLNRLDGTALHFFFAVDASLNGFRMTPRVTGTPFTVLPSGKSVAREKALFTPNAGYQLSVGTDGNLRLIQQSNTSILWSSIPVGVANTNTKAVGSLLMQSDGNLVLKSAGGEAIWSSNTAGNPGAELRLYNNGRMDIVSSTGTVLWTQGTSAAVSAFNPLRVTITNTTETIGGAFSMNIEGSNLYGSAVTSSFAGGRFPAAGLPLDLTPVADQPSGFSYVGIEFGGGGLANLTTNLQLKFPVAKFDGNILAQGTVGSEVAILEAKEGKITKGEITSPGARVIGDFQFQNFKATYTNNSTSKTWTFVGPAVYLGKQVNVGTPAVGNPQLKIGGDPKLGFQLQTISNPAELITPDFKLPSSLEIAGLNFDTALLPQDAPVVDQGPAGKVYSLKSQNYGVKIGNTTLSLSLGAKVRVSSSGVSVESFSATGVQNSSFTIGNASLQIKTLTVEYILAAKTLQISGDAKFTFKAKAVNVEMNVTLGTKEKPGLVIKDGAVDSFQVAVTGTFELLKLSIAAEQLTVEYKKENQEYAVHGGIKLSTAPQAGVQVIKDLAVTLGNKDKPGIKIVNGSLDSLDITINGEINLFKITATPKNLRISYTAARNQLQITGELTITLAPKLELTAALPGDGLLIDTSTGKVQIRGLSLAAQGDIKFGTMTIKGLMVEYSEDESGEVSIAAAAEIQLPSGLAVGGSFKIINGKLDAIGISFEKNPGIQVANGLVNIYRIEASVEGLTNLDNFKISGRVKATVGPLVKFGGESYALADVTGTINITPTYLELLGDVQLVGGKFGNGQFAGRLLWNPKPEDKNQSPRVTFDAEVNLYPGDIVRGKISAYADINGNVDFTAQMGVFIPQAVPMAGGISLGQLNVELRIRPAEEPSASYAKFGFSDIAVTAFRVPTFHGSVRIGFDKIVDYNFGARFYVPLPWPLPDIDYSINVGGNFQLRDASNNPFVEILAASSVSGTPNGEIVFSAMTPLPDDTFIDLYVDNDNIGNDGLLIASSIPYRAGSQTFVWEDMAAFASPGDPVYVYAVINDGKNAKGYSDYSPRFNVAPGFVPTVTNPNVVNFAAGDIAEFSAALGNKIVIGDPRISHKGDSEVEVILTVGGGTVDISHAPENVRYSGEGTSRMTLRGSAIAITSALDGLRYAQRFATDATDTLEITVNNLPLENMGSGVTKSVLLDPNPLRLSLLPSQNAVAPNTITIGETQEMPLENINIASLQSSYVTGAKVAIVGYEKGQDLLSLPLDDEYFTDIDGSFDFDTGILTLSGFEWIEDYEYALRNIIFTTKSATAGKSLSVSLADDDGEKGQLVVPLTMVAGHAEPQLILNSTGVPYIVGAGEKTLLPEGIIDIADSSSISNIVIRFVEDSYVAGEDLLSYTGPTISGQFDTVNGVLTLSGTGTEDDWSQALQQVKYSSIGATFTEGNRYIDVTVTDNGAENSTASAIFVVDKTLSEETHSSPVLTLTTANLNLPANEAFAYLDTELTLTASSSMLLWATVAISGNYIAGEDELAVTTTWEGITSEFDPLTGVLTISGLATVFEYEDVLRSVVFIDSAAYRTPGPAEIAYTIFDGLSPSEIEQLTIAIAAAPYVDSDLDRVLHYDGGQTADPINDTFTIQHSGQISGANVTISGGFTPGEDVLIFADGNGITGNFNAASGVLSLSGTASTMAYETALATVLYKNTRFNPSAGDRVIEFQVLDGTSVSNVSQSLVVVDADVVPPDVSFAIAPSYTEDGSPVAIAPNFTLTSRDASVTFLSAQEVLYGAEISILNYLPGEDLLSLLGDPGNIEGTFDAIEGRIFLTGEATFDEYEAIIRNIVYSNSSDVPTTVTRQISIRLLESGANGLNNQAITTQVIVGVPDPVTLVSGDAADVRVMQNEDSIGLGFEDLVFATQDFSLDEQELVFMAINLPSELLGSIVMFDGTRLQLNTPYSITRLQELRFEPQLGTMGVADFTYSVALSDLDSGNLDSGAFTDTIKITIDGIATTTPTQSFVAQMLRDLLGKNPDEPTLTSLASKLEQKLKRIGREENGFIDEADARQSLVAEFMSSDIYHRAQINDFYQSILHRTATTDELNSRLAELGSGKTLEQVKFSLLASEDYFRLQSGSGFAGYVSAIYQQLLNRDPSSTESARGVKQSTSGMNRQLMVTEIGNWANVNETAREAIVADLLHRDIEFNDSFQFDFTGRLQLIQSIIASDEYYLRSSTPTNTNRILTHATTDFPSVGKLGDVSGDKAGGTLIAPQYVLVAAHSVNGLPPGQLTFTIGGTKYRIADVSIHPDYDRESAGTDFGNDIAILKLNVPIVGIAPAALSGVSPRLGDMLKLVGFGQEDGAAYGTKRVGSTPTIHEIGSTVFRWTQTSEIQNDSDSGDSGSPLFKSIDGVDQVVGIVSGGTHFFQGIGDTSTNTRVDKYLEWIRSVVPTVQVIDAIDAPSIAIPTTELFIDENAGLQTIPIQVSADSTNSITVESGTLNAFSDLRVESDESGNGVLLFETATNMRGTALILVHAIAETGNRTETITVTVEERNDKPTIDPVPVQSIDAIASPRTIALGGISAGIGEQGEVRLALVSTSPAGFLSANGISYVPGATIASLNYTPSSSATGRGSMVVEVRDKGIDGIYNSEDDGVQLQQIEIVLNNAPTLNAIANLYLLKNSGEQSIALNGISSGDSSAQALQITASSSVLSVVSDVAVDYIPTVSGTTGQLKFTPSGVGRTVITVSVRDSGLDGAIDSDDDRVMTRTFIVDVVESFQPWQNPVNALDVDDDNAIGSNDVLVIINAINRTVDGQLPTRVTSIPPFYDVNGNGFLEHLDALVVINAINRGPNGEGEPGNFHDYAGDIDRVLQEDTYMDELVGPLWSYFDWNELTNSSKRFRRSS